MYMLTIRTSFAAAHNLVNYQGDCENLHGHNWKVEVAVTARELDKAGLGIDFKVLKREAGAVINELDHKYLNDNPVFRDISPSSEHISKYLYQRISERLNNDNIKVDSITVWESDNASARYYERADIYQRNIFVHSGRRYAGWTQADFCTSDGLQP